MAKNRKDKARFSRPSAAWVLPLPAPEVVAFNSISPRDTSSEESQGQSSIQSSFRDMGATSSCTRSGRQFNSISPRDTSSKATAPGISFPEGSTVVPSPAMPVSVAVADPVGDPVLDGGIANNPNDDICLYGKPGNGFNSLENVGGMVGQGSAPVF